MTPLDGWMGVQNRSLRAKKEWIGVSRDPFLLPCQHTLGGVGTVDG